MQYPTITKCAVEYSTFGEISGTSNLDYNDYPMVILLLIKPLSFIMVYPPPGKGMGLIIFLLNISQISRIHKILSSTISHEVQ